MTPDLRLYTFCNFYLSSIQQGIQSAHVTHSLFVKYPSVKSNEMLWDWAKHARTMIVLNGGANTDVHESFNLVSKLNLEYEGRVLPFESFNEDEMSLGGVMTCWGIVLPRQIYDARFNRDTMSYVYDDGTQLIDYAGRAENEFLVMLKNCGLAR